MNNFNNVQNNVPMQQNVVANQPSNNSTNNTKITNTIIAIVFIFLVFLAGFLFFIYEAGYLLNIRLNGTRFTKIKVNNFDNYLEATLKDEDRVFDIYDLDKECVIYKFAGSEEYKKIKFPTFLKYALFGHSIDLEVLKTVDMGKLIEWLDTYNEDRQSSISAYIQANGDYYEIVPQELGTKIDVNAIVNEVTPYKYNHIVVSDYIKNAEITESDLQGTCKQLNDFIDWTCVYTNGKVLKSNINNVFLDDVYGVIYDDSFIEQQVADATESYNAAPEVFSFNTSLGTTIDVPNRTLTCVVDEEAEIEYLKNAMHNLHNELNRTPIMKKDFREIGNTYVEVSIEKQHLWYYKDGELQWDCSVVTGMKGKKDTPIGCYYVTEMVNGKYLTGADYKTWVNRWMRLTGDGIGLHDANWRSTFGGDIYTYDGSHGCVNMPNQKAADLYKDISVGTVVIIY